LEFGALLLLSFLPVLFLLPPSSINSAKTSESRKQLAADTNPCEITDPVIILKRAYFLSVYLSTSPRTPTTTPRAMDRELVFPSDPFVSMAPGAVEFNVPELMDGVAPFPAAVLLVGSV
jgi:hypothetical protein